MAAPKGNKFWKKSTKHGRKGKFKNEVDLEKGISQYFNSGVKTVRKEVGSNTVEIPTPTITGLCFFLGFASRQSFYDLEKKEEFSYIVRRARLFIEREYEEQLRYGNVTGAIFALKNMGWADRIEQDLNTRFKGTPKWTVEVVGDKK